MPLVKGPILFHHAVVLSACGLNLLHTNIGTASAPTEIVLRIFPIAIWSICERPNSMPEAMRMSWCKNLQKWPAWARPPSSRRGLSATAKSSSGVAASTAATPYAARAAYATRTGSSPAACTRSAP